MLGQDAQEAEEGGCCGEGRKAEKGQAGRGYFNLINDRAPLRVCFNNQDTLQQVDRMFAVNLHMSSEQAVSINNVREHKALQPLLEPAGRAPLSPGGRFSLLVSRGSGQRRTGVRGTLAGVFPFWGVPRSPHQNKSTIRLAQKNHCGYDVSWNGSIGWCIFRQQMSKFSYFPGMLNFHPRIRVRVTPLVAPARNTPGNPGSPS